LIFTTSIVGSADPPGIGGAITVASLNHLARPDEKGLRDLKTEGLGSFEVDDEFVEGRQFHREVGRLCSSEDLVNEAGRAPVPG